jgi:hypothetical protein
MIFTNGKALHWGHYVWRFLIPKGPIHYKLWSWAGSPLYYFFLGFIPHGYTYGPICSFGMCVCVCVCVCTNGSFGSCVMCMCVYISLIWVYVCEYIYTHTYALIRALWYGLSSSRINQTDHFFFPCIDVLYCNLQKTLQTGWKESRNFAFIFKK